MNKQVQAQQALKAALLQAGKILTQMQAPSQGGVVRKASKETQAKNITHEVLSYCSADLKVILQSRIWEGIIWWSLSVYDARDPDSTGAYVELFCGSDREDYEVACEYLADQLSA